MSGLCLVVSFLSEVIDKTSVLCNNVFSLVCTEWLVGFGGLC